MFESEITAIFLFLEIFFASIDFVALNFGCDLYASSSAESVANFSLLATALFVDFDSVTDSVAEPFPLPYNQKASQQMTKP